ncbi:MAG TPA: DUF5996 family protein [Xanthobacteraceae bacterium]|nr:DUF5996 family protein [Xanthobacteraceae bacterium]
MAPPAEFSEGFGKSWPRLDYSAWAGTCAALHLWTQVVGKIRLALAPPVNHWWAVTLYVTARGLTTSAMPWRGGALQIDFDFIDHQLILRMSDGRVERLALAPRTVADFYAEVMRRLHALGVGVRIWTMPVEIPDAIPFDADHAHRSYDAEAANLFWQQLVQVHRVFNIFRARFLGKCSPAHFFWGSFDLAVTRFSGRAAPPIQRTAPNLGLWVMQEAYSHEVSSAGFWPGNGGYGKAAFYSYAYPEPQGFAQAAVNGASYDSALGEFVLPYDAVAKSASPDETLLTFLQVTYDAAAGRAKWDRAALERNGPGK